LRTPGLLVTMQTMKSCSFTSLLCTLGIGLFLLCLGPACHAQSPKNQLLIYGGNDHKIFLGCLNCVVNSPTSVCNENGRYGWDLQPNSIWNPNGKFGSDISPTSPWNDLGRNPPLLKTPDGASFGYLTTNTLNRKRTPIPWVLKVLNNYIKTNDLVQAHKMLCDTHSSTAKTSASAQTSLKNSSQSKISSHSSDRSDPPFPFVLQTFHALAHGVQGTLHRIRGKHSAGTHCSQNGKSSPSQNCPEQTAKQTSPAGNASTPSQSAPNF
jgi:hypothetical protein